MLIGAHVSTSGGLPKAVERGIDRGCRAIQIFNQSPRMWRPTDYGEEDFAAFREAMDASEIDAVMIHAVYLLNCASDDSEIAGKSLTSLVQSLRIGDAIGAHCVVLHPGSALKGPLQPAIDRAGRVIAEALAQTDRCPLHLENTAGAGGTIGRSFEELAAVIEAAGGHERLGLCLDSCHLLASGFDVRDAAALSDVVDSCVKIVGRERLGSLHLNDSQTPLGSNRDRHANLGKGEIGEDGCAVFLSEPRFSDLPCVLETPSTAPGGSGSREEVQLAMDLRERGQKERTATGGAKPRSRRSRRSA